MANNIRVVQSPEFQRSVKKLHKNQKIVLDKAVRDILNNPLLGQQKLGDLAHIRVHKFSMVKQLTLLAYSYHEKRLLLQLLAFGSHKNFYRDLKKIH